MLYKVVRFFLFLLPPEKAHAVVIFLMKIIHSLGLAFLFQSKKNHSITLNNITFKNPIGIAAGFDKTGTAISVAEAMGTGFIEVGTFTPKAQAGNPRPRLFRIKKFDALINRMGLNNVGFDQAIINIKAQNYTIPLGISIGKNNDTPDEKAIDDYLCGMEKMYCLADYLAINISCPNVPKHNLFWGAESFHALLDAVKAKQLQLQKKHNRYVPVFIKISPDLHDDDVLHFCRIFNQSGLDGVIAVNTSRDWRPAERNNSTLKEKGGFSGPPLFSKMLTILKLLKLNLKPEITLIALGGINSPEAAEQCFKIGADLIQIYTGLVYEGPSLIRRILRSS